MPKVSIIIPFNNGKKYLDTCLKNIEKIEYDDYEIILIDDFSNDNSEKIAKKYKKLKYYYTEEKTIGVGNARNFGIEKANGRYIMFVDVDDTIDTLLLKKLDKYINRDIEMIKYNMQIIKDEEVINEKNKKEVNTITGERAFNKLCFVDNYLDSPCLYLIKKELLERTNLKFEKNIYHEDFGLIPLLIINAKSMVLTDIYGYNYYQSENSIMRNEDYSKNTKKVNDKFFLYDKLIEKVNRMNFAPNTKRRLLEYYTNSIILSLKDLKKEDRIFFEKKINEKNMIKNLRTKKFKQLIKKILLKIDINLYFKILDYSCYYLDF